MHVALAYDLQDSSCSRAKYAESSSSDHLLNKCAWDGCVDVGPECLVDGDAVDMLIESMAMFCQMSRLKLMLIMMFLLVLMMLADQCWLEDG